MSDQAAEAGGQPWTIRRVLEWTQGFFERKRIDAPRLSAELILSHVLAAPRIKLYTEYDRPMSQDALVRVRELVARAGEHEPIAYLTGRAHFFNLEFEVTRDVLIPRPDTETLVEHIIQWQRHAPGMESPRILDLCTGSGCIAAALAASIKTANIVATDISPRAAAVARANLQRLKLTERVTVLEGDLFDALNNYADRQPWQVIVANPPYIPSANIAALDRNVRDFEPLAALDGGSDGLNFHRRILQETPSRLAPAGRVYLEMQHDQGAALIDIARQSGFLSASILKDHAGNDRCVAIQGAE